jgi:hypothetical protein
LNPCPGASGLTIKPMQTPGKPSLGLLKKKGKVKENENFGYHNRINLQGHVTSSQR